jgi:hypothetical protein
MARGRYEEAAALQPADIEHQTDPVTIATTAVLAARMQKLDESERLFELARERVPDVSPFSVAWMDFQRATVLEANGADVQAREYYAEACEVIPAYAHAAVHLASRETPGAAIPRLEALRATSDDPDVLAALADAHRRAGHQAESKSFLALARARYGEVVGRHPEAFGDHAARFYLEQAGDPQVALTLARDSAKLRPTEQALDLWMAAAAGANATADVCAAATAMKGLRFATERGRQVANAAASGCGDAGR